MKVTIEIDGLVGYQFRDDKENVVKWEDLSRKEQIKVLNGFANGYELFIRALKEQED